MYEVTATQQPVVFGATGIEEVQQSLRTILTTIEGNVPLDRRMGLPVSVLDEPLPVAQARLTAIIFRLVRIYEPRVEVQEVTFNQDASGRLIPTIRFDLKEGVTL